MYKDKNFTENDWKLFKSKIGQWQELYIDRLNNEYIQLLSDKDKVSSEKNEHSAFNSMVDRLTLPKKLLLLPIEATEFDKSFDIVLTRKHSNIVRNDRKIYKFLSKHANFDFLENTDFTICVCVLLDFLFLILINTKLLSLIYLLKISLQMTYVSFIICVGVLKLLLENLNILLIFLILMQKNQDLSSKRFGLMRFFTTSASLSQHTLLLQNLTLYFLTP
ncbi:MAG: hypothetical protein R3Y35_10210 [Clostridia bacterium]